MMRVFNKLRILLLVLSLYVLSVQNGFSREQAKPDAAQIDTITYYYRQFSTAINRPMFRDFATSPLFYEGFGVDLQTAWLKRSEQRERQFETGLSFNSMSAKIPESSFIQASTGSFLGQLNIRYTQLWSLDILPNAKNNFKLGGSVQSTQNFRINTNLQNNFIGLENISNLMVSGQVIRDISREKTRKLNFWLLKPTLNPVKRELRFQFYAGILNFNYRPGYTYIYDSEIIGLETNPINWIFSNYKWSLNGWRFNTELEYITYLPNGNTRSWSYVWGAINAPGRHETFQMASHQIRYTYYFHTRKR